MEWTNDNRWWYREIYLKSEHWRELRAHKLRLNPACERCEATERLEPHHKSYRHIFDVTTDDLETLCRKCHTKEHEANGMPKRKKVSYEKYFPAEVRARLAKQDVFIDEDGNNLFKWNNLTVFEETIFLLFDSRCAGCGQRLNTKMMRLVRPSDAPEQGILSRGVWACRCCFNKRRLFWLCESSELLEKFQSLMEEAKARRAERMSQFRSNSHTNFQVS